MTLYLLFISSIIFYVNFLILFQINNQLSSTYMDEYFHHDQTNQYCQYNFNYWNDKLTTFPLLYFIAIPFMKVFEIYEIFRYDIHAMRAINVIFSFLLFITLFKIFHKSYFFKNSNLAILNALYVYLLPISYFFTFLYYTDIPSSFFVILFFYLQENRLRTFRFMISILCVLVRQNNIVWINFFILSEILQFFTDFLKNFNFSTIFKKIINLIKENFEIFMIDVIFVGYIKNKEGDKSHHTLTLHLSQLNHLIVFIIFFYPNTIIEAAKTLCYKKKLSLSILFLTITFVLIFNYFSYTHDFILSDNRHYSFYYFKKIFNILKLRTILLTAIVFISTILLSHSNLNAKLGSWFICTFAVIVPSKLFEFRYFTISMLLLTLIKKDDQTNNDALKRGLYSVVNLIWMVILNGITLYIFSEKPFINTYFSMDYSRFMW